ncbi:MAG: mercury methylation corrinoid protein HgcA [Desulfomonilaceae bacterium]
MVGDVPAVSSRLEWTDYWGSLKVRFEIGRMKYTVDPGLYAVGQPDRESPVIVTGNYKLTFDSVRQALAKRDAWLLVLDTKGVNVWCAAGKGVFGTDELVARINSVKLPKVVFHRKLILPQLSGPGIAGYVVKQLTGFRVIYGPVEARDIPAFLDNGLRATPEMRTKEFPVAERAVLIPVEVIQSMKYFLPVAAIYFLVNGLAHMADFWNYSIAGAEFSFLAGIGAVIGGAVITPLLLPWLPGRSFSVKGLVAGILTFVALIAGSSIILRHQLNFLQLLASLLLICSGSSFIGANFTGSSTFTSLSGVKKEMRIAAPLQIVVATLSLCAWISSGFIF